MTGRDFRLQAGLGLEALLLLLIPSQARPGENPPGEITPGDSLVVQGLPSIPASLATDVGGYTKARAAELLGWHPSKREILIATFFGDKRKVVQTVPHCLDNHARR